LVARLELLLIPAPLPDPEDGSRSRAEEDGAGNFRDERYELIAFVVAVGLAEVVGEWTVEMFGFPEGVESCLV
jgi:hypothetical protein